MDGYFDGQSRWAGDVPGTKIYCRRGPGANAAIISENRRINLIRFGAFNFNRGHLPPIHLLKAYLVDLICPVGEPMSKPSLS